MISVFHNRLIDAGKPIKVAIVACMRKLLTILNAMLTDQACRDATKARSWGYYGLTSNTVAHPNPLPRAAEGAMRPLLYGLLPA